MNGAFELRVRTQKFNLDGAADPQNTRWIVPIVVGSRGRPRHHTLLLEERAATFQIPDVNPSDWLSVSLQQEYVLCICSKLVTIVTIVTSTLTYNLHVRVA